MLNFDQFRLLTFDCYGTLIIWETGIFSVLRPILDDHGKTISTLTSALYSDLSPRPNKATSVPIARFSSWLSTASASASASRRPNPRYAPPDSVREWLPFPDTVAALGKLKARYQFAVISNVDDDLFAPTARRLEVPFDYVITAQQARAYKPSLQIFKLAQQRTG